MPRVLDRGGKKSGAPKKKESWFMSALAAIQTPLFITAGLVKEEQRRRSGMIPEDRGEIIKESAANLLPFLSENRRRTTYHDVVDNRWLAFGLDIFGDPITYVPSAVFLKGAKGVKFLGKTTLSKLAAKMLQGFDKKMGTDLYGVIVDARDTLGKAFKPFYGVEKIGGKPLARKSREFILDLEELPRQYGEWYEKELMRLVPNEAERAKITRLVELRPYLGQGHGVRMQTMREIEGEEAFLNWQKEVMELSPESRKGYHFAATTRTEFEKIKVLAGLITEERMAGFRKVFGINYVTHAALKRDTWKQFGKDFLRGIEGGDEATLRRAAEWGGRGGAKKAVKDVKKLLTEIERSGEVLTAADLAELGKIPFLNPRIIPGSAHEIAAQNLKAIELDMAKLLGIEGAQLGRALATKRYIQEMAKYTRQKGVMFDEEMLHPKNAAKLQEELTKRFGAGAKTKFRKGFRQLENTGSAELDGKYVPTEIADEITRVAKAYSDPSMLKDFLAKYKKTQDIWKAWTLALFPAYHSRNAISNMWNNFLAGMGPGSVHHYHTANVLLWKRWRGMLNPEEKATMAEALRYGVLQGGQFEGEIGHLFTRALGPNNFAGKAIDPAVNPAIKGMYRTGRAIEHQARLAHFLWARNSKGMSAAEAASSVNKYLFDYKYGLTPFEKGAFRDFLMPFYAWTRFNIPLQLEMLAVKPGRFSILPKAIRAATDLGGDGWGNPDDDELFMADWMKRALKVRLRYNKELEGYEYFILDSWIPSADVGKVLSMQGIRDMLVGLWSPFTKVPIEVIFNYNLFRKKKIREYGLPFTKTGQKKKLLGVPLWPEVEHAARSIRIFNESDKIIDAFFSETKQTSAAATLTSLLVGKVYPYKPEGQRRWWLYQASRRIQELKRIRKWADKTNDMGALEKLDKLIAEAEAEREYFQKLKVDTRGVRR